MALPTTGLGDRVSQTVNSTTTRYTLDLNAGLTQVLADGTNTYLYGVNRIGEQQPGGFAYHLPDALGSVRQLTSASGSVTLAKGYQPYGTVLNSSGSGISISGFTGEVTDNSGLVFLRARYLSTYLNQFIQPDPIVPDPTTPQAWNRYSYVNNNPINLTDPSGMVPCRMLPPEDQIGCEGGGARPVLQLPQTVGYSEKVNPRNITWFPIQSVPRAGGIPANTNEAQYEVYPGKDWYGLCGEVTLAAILRLTNNSLSARDVVDALIAMKEAENEKNKKPPLTEAEKKELANYTGPNLLAELINEVYGENWQVDDSKIYRTHYMPAAKWRQSAEVGSFLRSVLQSGGYPVVGVDIDGSTGRIMHHDILDTRWANQIKWAQEHPNEPVPNSGDYILCNSPVVCHWVAITGVSNEWGRSWSGRGSSPWQWVRVYNPFDNQTEYYWWPDFNASWSGVGGMMLLVQRR